MLTLKRYINKMKKSILLSTLLILSIALQAQDVKHFEWLTGTWKGPGFGGIFEEVWSKPDASGQLMGMFRYSSNEGEIKFYEFWVLSKDGMKLRHFNPDFTAWEDKEKFIDFKMVETSENKVTLKGLTYERISDNEMKISLRLKEGEEVKTEIFNLKREE